jgi:uncharacterized protein (TIGR02145 family)
MPLKHLAFTILTITFLACSGNDTLTYGGQTYKTVKIGEQTWLAENLNYEAEGSVCYENNPANCAKYGRLYNWETALKVCPKGWHLPSNEEWDKLYRFVDGDTGTENSYKSETAGKHLKAKSGWNDDDDGKNGTDKYGFSALPGGLYFNGSFDRVGDYGYWYSASEYEYFSSLAYYRFMYDYDDAYSNFGPKFDLFSVRCLQD